MSLQLLQKNIKVHFQSIGHCEIQCLALEPGTELRLICHNSKYVETEAWY